MLQIGKVHERAAALFGSVARAELQRQPQQALHRGRGGAQVAKHFFGRFRVLRPQLLHGLLAQVAPRLDLVFQVRVGRIADGFQARERNVRQRLPGLVPALQGRARDGAQSGGGLRNAFAVGGHEPLGAGLRHALQQPLQLACPVGGGLARLREQLLPPDGLTCVGHALQPQPVDLRLRPAVGPGVALHFVVEIQNERAEPRVVPPGTGGVRQQAEGGVLVNGGIGVLQQLVERHDLERVGALGVGHLEVRREPHGGAIFAQNVAAEAVDGADLRAGAQRALAAEPAVFRVGRDARGDAVENARTQLGRGGAGIGDDEEPVEIDRLLRIGEPGHEPLREHAGLAAARGGGDEHRAAARADGALLRRGKVQLRISHASRLLPARATPSWPGAFPTRGGGRRPTPPQSDRCPDSRSRCRPCPAGCGSRGRR